MSEAVVSVAPCGAQDKTKKRGFVGDFFPRVPLRSTRGYNPSPLRGSKNEKKKEGFAAFTYHGLAHRG
jgi:hypothetical protein